MAEKRTYTYDELVFYDEGYFSEEELQEFVGSKNWMERRVAAEHGVGVDKLIDDPRWEVRRAVAERGFGLDTLVNDAVPEVRAEAAYHGLYLERLLVDESPVVRAAVASHGYRTDLLVNDPSEYVRAGVAFHGDNLDRLADDESPAVREEVARHGYGLEKLVDDEDTWVRRTVAEQGYGLDKLVDDESHWVRAEVARQGYGLEILVGDKNESVRELSNMMLEEKAREWALEHPNRCAMPEYRNRVVPSLEEFFNETAHAILHDAVEKVASALRADYGGVVGLDDNLVHAITDVIADKVEWGLRENTAVENAAKTAAAISHARAVSLGILEEQQAPRSFKTTPAFEESLERYIAELHAKKKEILDAGKDEPYDMPLVDREGIISDIFLLLDEDMEYGNTWPVTENYDSDYPFACKAFVDPESGELTLAAYGEVVEQTQEQTRPGKEKGRERGELKSAGKKPKQPQGEKVTLAADEMAAKRSAAARGVEGPVPEKTRRK